ncbi:MAG: adenylate/guanylate cyclase domain-containing protein [Actinobacteria bacterium]|nr:MAG: adenylate/guanylate cyclase domain-containing protein [Actinomycetota bacterium]
MDVPDVSYARSGEVAIAYQVVGEGPIDIVFVRGTLADLLAGWDMPLFVKHVEGMAESGRVLLFDKRGSGLSDPVRQVPTLETRMDDLRAVMDAVDSERAVLWAAQEGSRIALLFAATYPERTSAVILYDPTARGLWAPDYPWAATDEEWRHELREIRDRWGDRRYLVERAHRLSPFGAQNEEWLEWFVWYQRRSASPAEAVAFHRMSMEGDVREVLPSVRAPTLVLHRAEARDEAAFVADRVSGAKRVEVEGLHDWFSWADPEHNAVLLRETRQFIDGLAGTPAPDRVLATIMFTDIVGSTERAAELGDAAWSELLARHHTLVRGELVRFRGEELDTSGDGFFAAFDGPGRAIECAAAIRDAVRSLGLEVRAGLHTGECERVDGKLGGIAVPTGARIAALAEPGEVLVSSTVKDLVAGSGIEFEDRGTRELKGVPGDWRLYAVT